MGTSGERRKAKPQFAHVLEEEVSLICSLSGKGGAKVTLLVSDTDLEMEFDICATVTVRPKQVYEKHLAHEELKHSTVKQQAYNGEKLKVQVKLWFRSRMEANKPRKG